MLAILRAIGIALGKILQQRDDIRIAQRCKSIDHFQPVILELRPLWCQAFSEAFSERRSPPDAVSYLLGSARTASRVRSPSPAPSCERLTSVVFLLNTVEHCLGDERTFLRAESLKKKAQSADKSKNEWA